VAALLRDWRERGWLRERSAPAEPRPATRRHYRLLGTRFRLCFAAGAQLARVHPVLSHLAAAPGAPDVDLELACEGASQRLLEDGREVERCPDLAGLAPLVKASLWRIALNRSRYFMEIHAAALARGGSCVLLPGRPGSGKSTLAAALLAEGFRYLSDESALLEEQALRARPVPLALCVKPGSLPLLEPLFPGLGALPAHRREDGQRVRYLAPPERSRLRDPERSLPVTTLVFPRVAPRTALRPLPRPEALRRLLAQCLVLPQGLDAERVRHLVAWLRGVRCFELASGPLPDAVAAVRRAHAAGRPS
jgi:hypothetical protein